MLEMKIGEADEAMDWLTFISSIVGSIAWPIAAFAIAYLFRVQIIALLGRIKTLRMGDNAVDFRDKLEEAEAIAEAAPEVTIELGAVVQQPSAKNIENSKASGVQESQEDTAVSEIDKSPTPLESQQNFTFGPPVGQPLSFTSNVILYEWDRVERDVFSLYNDTYNEKRIRMFSNGQVIRLAWKLANDGHISDFVVKLLEDLQQLRNSVVHGATGVTRSDASRFRTLANQVRQMLKVGTTNVKPDSPDA